MSEITKAYDMEANEKHFEKERPKAEFKVIEGINQEHDYVDNGKGDYERVEKTVEGFYSPCGVFFKKVIETYEYPNGMDGLPDYSAKRIENEITRTKESIISEHCDSCIECKIISGFSHANVMSQDSVANLFGLGIDGKRSSSANFESDDGILMHYRTVQAIRLKDGTVILNNECWAGGFAHCSHPRNTKFRLDLSSIAIILNGRRELLNIEILENDSTDASLGTLFKYKSNDFDSKERFFLNAENKDGRGRFVVELIKPCKTLIEAYESMKPKEVVNAESQGIEVKRQGELFFIPLPNNNKTLNLKPNNNKTLKGKDKATSILIKNIQKREKHKTTIFYGECSKCGIKTKPTEDKTDWNLKQHPRFRFFGNALLRSHKNEKIQAAIECAEKHHGNSDSFMVVKSRIGNKFTPDPIINLNIFEQKPRAKDLIHFERTRADRSADHHSATQLGILDKTQVVAKGTVRHTNGDHVKLALGDTWHIVMHNLVVRALSSGDHKVLEEAD